MANRVTQDYVEALLTLLNPRNRVTQDYVEVLVADRPSQTRNRVTQDYIEVLVIGYTPPTPVIITQGPRVQMMG